MTNPAQHDNPEDLVREIEELNEGLRQYANSPIPSVENAKKAYETNLSELQVAINQLEAEMRASIRFVLGYEKFLRSAQDLTQQLERTPLTSQFSAKLQQATQMMPVGVGKEKLDQLQATLTALARAGDGKPELITQDKLEKLFHANINAPVESCKTTLEEKLSSMKDRLDALPDEITEVVEAQLMTLPEHFGEMFEEIDQNVDDKIELGESLSEELDSGISDLLARVESAVDQIQTTFAELEAVWENVNEDLPESGGALTDAIAGFEAAQEAIESVYE